MWSSFAPRPPSRPSSKAGPLPFPTGARILFAMATKTTFIVQQFEMKRGQLVPGAKDIAPTANGAIKRAEAVAARAKGTAALKIEADDETGEVHKAQVLAQFGQVPDDFKDSLTGG